MILSIYILDFVLMVCYPGVPTSQSEIKSRASIAQKFNMPFDARTKLEVVQDQRANGNPLYLSMGACHFIPKGEQVPSAVVPLAGLSDVNTLLCNEGGSYVTYHSDRYGFRNPDQAWTKDNVDVALLGDSFAQGCCVTDKQEMGSLLRKMGYSVINLGLAGNGPLVELASIIEYAGSVHPKNVFWMYFEGNDFRNLKKEKTCRILSGYLEKGYAQNLISRQPEIDRILKGFVDNRELKEKTIKKRKTFKPTRILKLKDLRVHLANIVEDPQCEDEIDPIFERILTRARDVVSSWGGNLYFVYLPQFRRYYYLRTSAADFCNKEAVLSLVHRMRIPVIDMDLVFARESDPLSLFPFRIKGHYTGFGYSLVAQSIHQSVAGR